MQTGAKDIPWHVQKKVYTGVQLNMRRGFNQQVLCVTCHAALHCLSCAVRCSMLIMNCLDWLL